MRYLDFKNIIRHVRHKIHCEQCKNTFNERSISVVGIIYENALLDMYCPKCKGHMIVQVSMSWEGNEVRYNHTIGSREPVTENDVLDMHNFLKNFHGDFKNILKN